VNPKRSRATSEKILLVDDEKDLLVVMAERMRALGMDVSTTTCPLDALRKVEQESYDAVVIDLMMPEMDGFEALRAFKLKKPDLQVILLTGQATVENTMKAIKLGAMDLMEKPADLKKLIKKITEAKNRKILKDTQRL
jgi:two-component system OmpR family response regulator